MAGRQRGILTAINVILEEGGTCSLITDGSGKIKEDNDDDYGCKVKSDVDSNQGGVEVISAGSSVHQMIRAGSRPRSEYNLHLCAGRCRN